MALVIKHVVELKGYSFSVPSYQRGYRWTRKQIEQLLDDLKEFDDRLNKAKRNDHNNKLYNKQHPDAQTKLPENTEDEIGFYCLQPLAVSGDNLNWDLIDGQQRLTTIYLMLSYLKDQRLQIPKYLANPSGSLFDITYKTREDLFFKKRLFKTGTHTATDNIDFYFMTKAYITIGNWFCNNPGYDKKILDMLLPSNYNSNPKNLLHDVRFIWYETLQGNSILTFNNLNYGKIGLTSSELVKALLFQCDIYDNSNKEVERRKANSRSVRWSQMEEQLQNKYFWGMLTPDNYDLSLHLELILRFVASNINKQTPGNWNEHDEDWIFNIFSSVVADNSFKDRNGIAVSTSSERIDYLWKCILEVYSVFSNWFNDRKLYHWIGLIVFLNCNYDNKKVEDEYLKILRELYDDYVTCSKPVFEQHLKHKIKEIVKIRSTYNDDGKTYTKNLHDINYLEDADTIRKILLLFNVDIVLSQSQDEPRFPFYLANQLKLNSLEHIHPQHLSDENLDYTTINDWFGKRRGILNDSGILKKSAEKSELRQAVNRLESNLVNENMYNENRQQCLQDIEEVDHEFDELAGMDDHTMHSLCNMALVDSNTNAALSNKLIDEKREKLKTKIDSSYIPLGTWRVFNKYYTNDVTDFKFWSKTDREAYFEAIEKVYNSYN